MPAKIRTHVAKIRQMLQSRWASLRHQEPGLHAVADHGLEDILFETSEDKVAGERLQGVLSHIDLHDSVCPVTRRPLDLRLGCYQCRVCNLAYSPEGWNFLRTNARSQCCGCNSRKTVLYRPAAR